jgi:hypothetical protein
MPFTNTSPYSTTYSARITELKEYSKIYHIKGISPNITISQLVKSIVPIYPKQNKPIGSRPATAQKENSYKFQKTL